MGRKHMSTSSSVLFLAFAKTSCSMQAVPGCGDVNMHYQAGTRARGAGAYARALNPASLSAFIINLKFKHTLSTRKMNREENRHAPHYTALYLS